MTKKHRKIVIFRYVQRKKAELGTNAGVLTVLHDADFTKCEDSLHTLVPEPDHHITPSLSAALTLKLLLALERRLLIDTDLVVCKLGRWLGVRHSDVKVIQTLVCKYHSVNSVISDMDNCSIVQLYSS